MDTVTTAVILDSAADLVAESVLLTTADTDIQTTTDTLTTGTSVAFTEDIGIN